MENVAKAIYLGKHLHTIVNLHETLIDKTLFELKLKNIHLLYKIINLFKN